MVVHKIRELKRRGLRLGLLTNNVKEFGEHWRTMFPIDELFEEVVDSSHVGMRKPDREIYELTCSAWRSSRPKRCSSTTTPTTSPRPRAYGMEAVHFMRIRGTRCAELDSDPRPARHCVRALRAAERHLAHQHRHPRDRAGQEREVGADVGDVEQHALQASTRS